MDYRKAAQTICERIGGKENLVSAAHCATRLRLVVADDSKVDSKAIEAVEGVKGVFAAQGQLQVVFGTGVVMIRAPHRRPIAEAQRPAAGLSAPPLCYSKAPNRRSSGEVSQAA